MNNIVKFDNSEVTNNAELYDWTIGDTTYWLFYNSEGELEGFEKFGLDKELIDDIINNPWDYNFPCTLEEYNK
jgi:hypothetical protein